MLIEPNSYLYTYVIARDFGFAPNPFHGVCTLATCKPGIRKSAQIGDWILGVGGSKLSSAHRKCILLMKVTEKISFQDYWDDFRFEIKKPCRNGSQAKMLGDNIYHRNIHDEWEQEDSHHSNADGTVNQANLKRDVSTSDKVLISNFFFYFGEMAVPVDLESIGYRPGLGFKKINLCHSLEGRELINSIYKNHRQRINLIVADPCQFVDSHKRVDQGTGKIT
jgi:hypothetical protein